MFGQFYRDRADCEDSFEELKSQWGWGGFATRNLKGCRLMAGCVAPVFNWRTLIVRLADPDHHREGITSHCCSKPSAVEQLTPAAPR